MSQSEVPREVPVQPHAMRVLSIGVNPLDMRRVDVAVDLTPCTEAVKVEMVIVGPDDDELCSLLLVENRAWMIDKIMHLRKDAQPGEYVLHVGVFYDDELVTRAARRFAFRLSLSV